MTTDGGVPAAVDGRPEAALLVDTENLFYVYGRPHKEEPRHYKVPGLVEARLGWSDARDQAHRSLRAVIDWAELVVGDRTVTTKSGFGKNDDPGCKLLAERVTEEWSMFDGVRLVWPRAGADGWIAHKPSSNAKDAADLDLIAEFHRLRGASPGIDTVVFGGSDGRLRDALHGVLWGKQAPPEWWHEPRAKRTHAELGAETYDVRGRPEQQQIVRFAFVIDGRNAEEMPYNRWGALLGRANGALLREKGCPWRPPGSTGPSRWYFATLAQIRESQDEAARRSLVAMSATTRRAAPTAAPAAAVEPPWLELAEWFWSEKFRTRLRTDKPVRGAIEDKRRPLVSALRPEHRPHMDAMLARWADVFSTHAAAARDYDDPGPKSANWRKKLAAAMLVPLAEFDPSLTTVPRADDAFQLGRQWLGLQEEPRDA